MEEASGSTPLFGVFILSLYSIFIFPYTLTKLFGGEGDATEVVKTWSRENDASQPGLAAKAGSKLRKVLTPRMIAMWIAYALLLWYVSVASKPLETFDPFAILELSEDADDTAIRRAYRRLSLQYHPDKNPDPSAADYFANFISKAYKALTDETSRENYRKYGHPDGPQAMSLSVALPEWFFNKDKEAAPVILLVLLVGGIILPLGLAACYLGRSAQYAGPNEVSQETMVWYMHSPFAIKPNQAIGRIPETLVCAKEFLDLPTAKAQGSALDTLRSSLASTYPELKDLSGPFYKKRRQELVKAHLLLLAHLARHPVAPCLQKDQTFLLQKAPMLLQEMFNIAIAPRIRPCYGWMVPAVAVVEMMQCLVQAVPVDEKKKQTKLARSADSPAALLQLPHFEPVLMRKLTKQRVRSLPDLQALSKADRRSLLQSVGLAGGEAEDVEIALSALPTAFVSARILVEGTQGGEGAGILAEQDIVTCRAKVVLWRPSHMATGFDPDVLKGTAVRAYAPHYPFPRDEHWFFLVVNPATNALLGWVRTSLLKAEAVGARYKSNWVNKNALAAVSKLDPRGAANGSQPLLGADLSGDSQLDPEALVEEEGQEVEVQFRAPPAGKHDLFLYVMPDSWVGADCVLPFKLRTVEQSRAEREGRALREGRAPVVQRSEGSEPMAGGDGVEEGSEGGYEEQGSQRSGGSEDEDEEEEEEEEGEHDWDSDEYGTEETDDEASEGEGEEGDKRTFSD